jgi:MSHA biogenesis protein MshJ
MQPYLTLSWLTIKTKINQRSTRERILLLITGIVAIWIGLFDWVISPLSNAKSVLQEEKLNIKQQYEGTYRELLVLQEKIKSHSQSNQSPEVLQLELLLAKNNEKLGILQKKLMPPKQVPFLLEKMVADFAGLRLIKLESLPFKDNTVLHHQRIRIMLSGRYADLLAYMKKLETLNYPIWWEELEYKIIKFPQAQIVLTVYILTQQENWIEG